MALRIEGRVSQITPIEEGQGARGPWKKRLLIIDTLEQFPRKVAFAVWNERAEALDSLRPGERVVVDFSVESREYNGRWYTDARAFAIKVVKEEDVVAASTPGTYQPSEPRPTKQTAPSDVTENPLDNIEEDSTADEYADLLNDDSLDNDTLDQDEFFGEDDNDADDLPF